ncbi:glycosyltransferase family 22 protein [Mycena haematopus]|nr:glycosyltransferase family 22 protein [Mycena haematopus]
MTTTRFVICTALFVRVLIALSTSTVFQPDEYFQSLEPAHNLVFGYGQLTWEWLSPRPIRSILYPALNVPIYWFLKVTSLDTLGTLGDWLVIGGPRVLHGCFASLTDIFLCSLTHRVIGERYVSIALLISLTSMFNVLSLSRSLSNSLETSLTTVALSHYPWVSGPGVAIDRSRVRLALVFAALACAVRATNAIIWIYLFGYLLWQMRSSRHALTSTIHEVSLIGCLTLCGIFALDSLYYGKPTFTPLNFLATNLSNVSLFYGGNAWHYYLSQAIPIMCTTALPFTLREIWHILRGHELPALGTMLGCIIWTVCVYSLAGHKEWRFIHPLLPMLHLFATKSLGGMSTSSNETPMANQNGSKSLILQRRLRIVLLSTLPISCYIALLYCSAPIEVMAFIRSLPREELRDGGVGFLMPCHSTPGHAYLHRPELANGKMWALGCEPPLQNQDAVTYRDQTTVFFASPHMYLNERFPQSVDSAYPLSPFPTSVPGAIQSTAEPDQYPWVHEWPQYLVFFGALLHEQGVRQLLEERGYTEIWMAGRAWEGDCDERKGGVKVWKHG